MLFIFSLSLLLATAVFHLGNTTMALALLKPALLVRPRNVWLDK